MYLKIETKTEVIDLVNFIESSSTEWLAIDTEFFRETTYFPILSLIQIATASQVWVIDVISCKDIAPLKTILENQNIKKIFHAGEQDWLIFKHYINAKTRPFVDTQIMAAFAKLGHGASLEKLVLEILEQKLDKTLQKTNWLERPLSGEQLMYAAQDANFIAKIYPMLEEKIKNLERSDWVDEEMEFLLEKYDTPSFDKTWLKLCVKEGDRWPTTYYAYELVKWREQQAKKINLPKRHVLSDYVLEQILKKNSVDNIQHLIHVPKIYDALMIFWQSLLDDSKDVPRDCVDSLEKMVKDYQQTFSKEQSKEIRAWKMQAKKIAKKLDIPAFLFLNKRQIQYLANKDFSTIKGWRLELLKELEKYKEFLRG